MSQDFTIYNESLVYYALRDDSNMYLSEETLKERTIRGKQGFLNGALRFSSVQEAIKYRNKYPQFSKIRRVKLIDIGEVNQ